ncbi:MAG: hypothetical protein PUA56_04940 [Bacillales bacterium]|nr:hypothetical protein [Bacillales bacterium]
MNSVTIIGVLKNRDEKNPEIRYIMLRRDYEISSSQGQDDLIGIMNWDKGSKGEIFSFKDESQVAIKGRIEIYLNRPVIICEFIQYLGK